MLGVNERRTAECHAYFSDENEKKNAVVPNV